MLIDDIRLLIYPIGGKSRREGFKVTFFPDDNELEKKIALGINYEHNSYRLSDALYDFMRYCVYNLLVYGKSYYEIVYYYSSDDIVAFELIPLITITIRETRRKIFQLVPKKISEERDLPNKIQLEKGNVFKFEFPKEIKLDLQSILQDLADISSPNKMMPGFALKGMMNPGFNLPFDFKYVERAQTMAIAEITKDIGWNARSDYRGQALEYYWLVRELRFYKFLIILRNQIISDLNRCLVIVGENMGFKSTIQIEGLPKLEDVDLANKELKQGGVSFTEIIGRFQL